MNSNYGTSFISARANIGNNVLIGNNVSIYGSCKVGDNSIIESNAIIGHPSFVELNNIDRNRFCSLNEYYDACSVHPIIIGCNSVIRSNSVIYSGCRLGHNLDCGHKVIVRENCLIGDNVYIFVNTEFKRDVIVGDNCRIAGTLCDRTQIGKGSSMLGHTVHKYLVGVGGNKEKAPVIGSGVTVGREAVLIGEISIGDFSAIGANSVLTQSIPELSLYAGIPAKFIRTREKNEIINMKNLWREE